MQAKMGSSVLLGILLVSTSKAGHLVMISRLVVEVLLITSLSLWLSSPVLLTNLVPVVVRNLCD